MSWEIQEHCCTYCNGNHERKDCPHYEEDIRTFKRGQRWLAVKRWFKNLLKPNANAHISTGAERSGGNVQ